MVSTPPDAEQPVGAGEEPSREDARRYGRARVALSLASFLALVIFLAAVQFTGLSLSLRLCIEERAGNPWLVFLLFAAALTAAEKILTLPLAFYGGYSLEHRYGLSNQTPGAWALEQAKSLAVGVAITTPLLLLFFLSLRAAGPHWWIWTGLVVVLFSVVLAQLGPVLIFPLFYRFEPLEDRELEERLRAAAARAGLGIRGLFRFDLSRSTRKANAALAGLGRTRRVILADTLLGNLSHAEIESVFWHELGHHHHRHISRMLAAGTALTFLGLYLTHLGISFASGLMRAANPLYRGLDDPAFLPLFGLFLFVYSLLTSPAQNALSRRFEFQSDAYAVRQGPGLPTFVAALQKIAARNLADPEPNAVVEFVFHSHPSIARRIEAARELPLESNAPRT